MMRRRGFFSLLLAPLVAPFVPRCYQVQPAVLTEEMLISAAKEIYNRYDPPNGVMETLADDLSES